MNAVDFFILIAIIAFLTTKRNAGFIHVLLCSAGVFAGYIAGLVISGKVFTNQSTDFKIGLFSLLLMFGLALILGLLFRFISLKFRMKIVTSKLYKADRIAGWPMKVLVVISGIVLLSQTLVFIPIVGLQYIAQGSSILMIADKSLPPGVLENYAAKISAKQTSRIELPYSLPAITKVNLNDAGDFREPAGKIADSIFRISGVGCTGLGYGSGFVASPGLVVTNAHVVGGRSSLYMTNQYGSYPATPIIIDKDHDIAVLYSKFLREPVVPMSLEKLKPGMPAASMGYPGGGDLQIFAGSVSDQKYKSLHNKLDETNTFGLNAGLGPGSSGGPVINDKGEVIGINDAGKGIQLIAIQVRKAAEDVERAKGRPIPTKTGFCDVPPKFY